LDFDFRLVVLDHLLATVALDDVPLASKAQRRIVKPVDRC